MQTLFVGVDGGATKSTVRLEDKAGNLLGEVMSGPANIRVSVEASWQSIHQALAKILEPLDLSLQDKESVFHAGMGLAGCEIEEACLAFINKPHDFQTLTVTTDAHAACLGAHGGEDGAVISIGTGVVGFSNAQGKTAKVSGWGFPHDDEGGGAWLGLEAVRLTLKGLDGRLGPSALTEMIYGYFSENLTQLVSWANRANSSAFAALAPFVIRAANEKDAAAINLLKQACVAIESIYRALESAAKVPLPYCLLGGLAPYLTPYLSASLSARLRQCQLPPVAGAIALVREHLAKSRAFS